MMDKNLTISFNIYRLLYNVKTAADRFGKDWPLTVTCTSI